MRALRLDYRDNGRLLHLVGFVLLVMVLVMVAVTGWYFNSLRQETSHLESLIEKIEGKIHGQVTVSKVSQLPPEKLAEVIKFSNHAIHQLNLPWDTLFVQLEKAKGEGVALLSIEPNSKSSLIKVTGEAKDYAAMLGYVRSLSEQGVLQDVYLTEHKVDDQNPDKPVHFSLEASWVEK